MSHCRSTWPPCDASSSPKNVRRMRVLPLVVPLMHCAMSMSMWMLRSAQCVITRWTTHASMASSIRWCNATGAPRGSIGIVSAWRLAWTCVSGVASVASRDRIVEGSIWWHFGPNIIKKGDNVIIDYCDFWMCSHNWYFLKSCFSWSLHDFTPEKKFGTKKWQKKKY